MSKLGSKEEILSAIQSHFENIQSGNLTAEAMESLVELTRELHERALILRYRSYEEKIFGAKPASEDPIIESVAGFVVNESPAEPTEVVTEAEAETENELAEEATSGSTSTETQQSIGFEEVEVAILAAEPGVVAPEIPSEEPVFDFDMFEKAEAAEASQPEVQETVSEEEPSFDFSQSPTQEEPASEQKAFEILRTEAEQIANEIEESPVTVSEQMPVSTPAEEIQQPVEIQKEEEKTPEIPLPEELAIMNEPVIIPEKEPEVHQPEENDMFRRFSNTGNDNSLSSRLSATKLHTLAGAFGLNEKLQCIRELFKGSSEAFNNAIETLDQQENFAAAKRILAQYAQQNSWNLESNLTAEFIQKIERRFL